MKKLLIALLILTMVLVGCATNDNNTSSDADSTNVESTADNSKETQTNETETNENVEYVVTQEFDRHLKGSGKIKLKFKETIGDEFAESVDKVYFRLAPDVKDGKAPTPPTDADLIDLEKAIVSPVSLILKSELVDVKPNEKKAYEITLHTSDDKSLVFIMNIANIKPMDFTVRVIAKDGSVKSEKVFSYDEMKEMGTSESYYSGGCVMHGLFSHKAKGVYLMDLFEKAGVEFKEGMSFACRAVDAKTEIQATERNSSKKTGETFNNPERYWMKPRYTNDFKQTYENIFGRDRYFITAQWDDEEIGKILADDGNKFSFGAREALAKNDKYLVKVEPMIALQEVGIQYNRDKDDIREFDDSKYGLFEDEIGFRFLYGLAMDNDPVVNVTSYDKEKKEYPVVETPENAGKKAIEEGSDACGTSARMAKYVFGIDVFEAE